MLLKTSSSDAILAVLKSKLVLDYSLANKQARIRFYVASEQIEANPKAYFHAWREL